MFRDLFSREVANFGLLTLWSIHGGDKIIVVLSAEGNVRKGRRGAGVGLLAIRRQNKERLRWREEGRKERKGRGRGY
jgi:hypothetical protein